MQVSLLHKPCSDTSIIVIIKMDIKIDIKTSRHQKKIQMLPSSRPSRRSTVITKNADYHTQQFCFFRLLVCNHTAGFHHRRSPSLSRALCLPSASASSCCRLVRASCAAAAAASCSARPCAVCKGTWVQRACRHHVYRHAPRHGWSPKLVGRGGPLARAHLPSTG